MGHSLCTEYTSRFGKIHACEPIIRGLHGSVLTNGEEPDWLNAAQAMPDQYRVPGDPVAAYRAYYVGEKARMLNLRATLQSKRPFDRRTLHLECSRL